MINFWVYLAAFLLSLSVCFLIRKLLIAYGIFDLPKNDRWHKYAVPKFGGVGIFTATMIAWLIYIGWGKQWHDFPLGLLSGIILMFALGVVDDIKPMSPAAKLIGQISAASLVIYQGYTTLFFTPRLGNTIIAQLPNIILTFIWLVGITNAINLLDNMDGLAGGIALIASGFLSYLFWKNQDYILFSLSLSLSGALTGFLVWNFPPAKLFMGDSGSQFLGFTLALLAIARQPQASNIFAVMGVPTLILLLPILDTSFVTITRLLRGESPMKGGRDHTSHRLIAFGLDDRHVLLVFYVIAMVCGISAMILESLDYDLSLVLIPLIIIVLMIFTAYLAGMKISAVDESHQKSPLPTWIVAFAIRRNLLEVAFDFLLIAVSFYLAIFTKKFAVNLNAFADYLSTLPLALLSAYASFYAVGIYRNLWRYLGTESIFNFGKASLISALIFGLLVHWLRATVEFPISTFLFFGISFFFVLIASRYSFKALDTFSARQRSNEFEPVWIYGSDLNVDFVIQWLLLHPQLKLKPIGIISDESYKVNKSIQGVRIVGSVSDLPTLTPTTEVQGLIIATSGINETTLQNLYEFCDKNNWWMKKFEINLEKMESRNDYAT
ncbi:MAG: hypothetical protein ACPL3P_00475 [Anaerolineales bacterium]